MKTICYVRDESRKHVFTDDEFSDFPLTVENCPDEAWEKSDLGKIIENLDIHSRLVVADCRDLGRNILDSLETLAAIGEQESSMRIVLDIFYISEKTPFPWRELFLKLVEIERSRRSERSKEALRRKKASGVVLGRPPASRGSILDKHKDQIHKSLNQGTTQKFLAIKYKVSTSTMSTWMKTTGLRRKRS